MVWLRLRTDWIVTKMRPWVITVERRFKRRRYKRKVSLREYFRAIDHFDYVLKSQFRRKNRFRRKIVATDFSLKSIFFLLKGLSSAL